MSKWPEWTSPDGRIRLINADCRDALPLSQLDSCVTDPPYELGFMGKRWDSSGVAFQPETWAKVLDSLKPGAHLLAFGGTRTFHRLTCAIEDAGFEIRDCIQWIYGSGFPKSLDVSKAIDKAAGAEREVVGSKLGQPGYHLNPHEGHNIFGSGIGKTTAEQRAGAAAITAPATAAARAWQGWGTALKPAHEEIIWATKPLPSNGELRIVVENLSKLEAQLWSLLPANVAESSFGLSQREYDGACAFAQWSADERSNTRAALSARMDTSQFVSVLTSCLNIVMSWRSTLGASCAAMSTFITATKSSTTIAWSTLKSCSLALTPRIIIEAAINQPGSWWNVVPAARVLSAAAKSIACTRELSALASAIDSGRISRPDVGELEIAQNSQPIILARKPLVGTVAENVQEYGTGGLNIDGCRIDGGVRQLTISPPKNGKYSGEFRQGGISGGTTSQGRWPANVIHDGSEEVLSGFPQTVSNGGKGPHAIQATQARNNNRSSYGDYGATNDFVYGDSGSAARFFYTAKASRAERNGSKHPTVKPLALMRYLVRLITPPGGTVLDPFAGSGTTIEAARLERFAAIGIEQAAEYLPDIRARIDRCKREYARTALIDQVECIA